MQNTSPSNPSAPASQAGGWNAQQPALTLPGGRAVNPWLVLASLMFGFFMSLLDATIVNIAIPAIQSGLNTDLTAVSWVANAYSLTFAVLLITTGRLADQFGRKRMFMLGMILFTIGSVLCGFAPDINWLIGFRVLQAIGAACLTPVSLALIIAVFPARQRGAAIGFWGASAGLASAVGPVLGGVLVQAFGWPSIFFVNLPICIVGLFMVFTFVPEMREPNAKPRVDFGGLLTLTLGLFCLVLAVLEGNDWGWTSLGILGLFATTIVSLALFLVLETHQAQPILDLNLFRIRSFTAANITMFLFAIAVQGAFLVYVLYFIIARGKSELDAAYALLPLPLSSFAMAAIAGTLVSKGLPPRLLCIIGIAGQTIGFYLLSTIPTDPTYFDTAWRAVLLGLSSGMVFNSLPNMVLSEVPRMKLGVGSGTFNTSRQLGFVLGVALLISMVTNNIANNVAVAKTDAVSVVQVDTKLPQQLRDTIATNIENATQSTDGENSNAQYDLTTIAASIPNGEALKPELAALTTQIGGRFDQALHDAFTAPWLLCSIISLLGLIPAFFTQSPATVKEKDPQARPVMAVE